MTISTCIWGYVSDNFGRKMVTGRFYLISHTSHFQVSQTQRQILGASSGVPSTHPERVKNTPSRTSDTFDPFSSLQRFRKGGKIEAMRKDARTTILFPSPCYLSWEHACGWILKASAYTVWLQCFHFSFFSPCTCFLFHTGSAGLHCCYFCRCLA